MINTFSKTNSNINFLIKYIRYLYKNVCSHLKTNEIINFLNNNKNKQQYNNNYY